MTEEEKEFIESTKFDALIVIGNGFDLNLGLNTRY